jgi:Protein of unknown function (DUF1810)
MTLFSRVGPDEPVFRNVLDRYFAGQSDERTITRLGAPLGLNTHALRRLCVRKCEQLAVASAASRRSQECAWPGSSE